MRQYREEVKHMAQRKLESVDLELFGVQHTYRFDEPVELESELPDDLLSAEIAAGAEVLRHVTSLEVQLAEPGPATATVTVAFSIQYEGEVDVDLEDLEGYDDADSIRDGVESGDFYAVQDAIRDYIERNIDADEARIDNVDVALFDENGDDWEE
jgi:hypothetical protein